MRVYGEDALDLTWKQKLYPCLKPYIQRKSSQFFCQKWFEMISKYPFETCNYTGYVWWFDVMRLTYKREVFGKPVPMPFETAVMYCPEKWDELLTQQFGDYMALPPIEKQKPMHIGTVDLEHSYHDYALEKYPLLTK